MTNSFGTPAAGTSPLSISIVPATMDHFQQVLADHPRYWGEYDARALHLAALVHQFPTTSLVALADDGIRGYLFGFVTPDRLAYAHVIATRYDTRGTGLGRRLYAAFGEAARTQGALRLKAITSPENEGSIAFHRSLGFDARLDEDYNGPGRPRVIFTRDLPDTPADWAPPNLGQPTTN